VANGKTHSECINMVNSAYVKGHVYDNDLVKWLDYVDEMFFSI
jgi:hypothetical protein